MFLKIEFSDYVTIKILYGHQSQGEKCWMINYNQSLVVRILLCMS